MKYRAALIGEIKAVISFFCVVFQVSYYFVRGFDANRVSTLRPSIEDFTWKLEVGSLEA